MQLIVMMFSDYARSLQI